MLRGSDEISGLGRKEAAGKALNQASEEFNRWVGQMYAPQGSGHWVHHHGAELNWPVNWWDWLEFKLLHAEAHRLIHGVPPSDDPRLTVLRARALAALRRNRDAEPLYDEALKRLPNDNVLRFEALRSRGYARAGVGKWAEAAQAFTAAATLQPEEPRLWFFAAVAFAEAGDLAGYRSTRNAMFERFREPKDEVAACYLLRGCALVGDPLDPEAIGSLLRAAGPHGYLSASSRGSALYRAGQYAESVQCLEKAAKLFLLRASDWCFLAMAYFQLGDEPNAYRCRDMAASWRKEADDEDLDDLSVTRPAWGDWYERATFPRLFLETDALLKTQPGISASSK